MVDNMSCVITPGERRNTKVERCCNTRASFMDRCQRDDPEQRHRHRVARPIFRSGAALARAIRSRFHPVVRHHQYRGSSAHHHRCRRYITELQRPRADDAMDRGRRGRRQRGHVDDSRRPDPVVCCRRRLRSDSRQYSRDRHRRWLGLALERDQRRRWLREGHTLQLWLADQRCCRGIWGYGVRTRFER